ncbi:MAG: hypothetical protein HY787_19955 [Deltaproteobacteria bacterium]|nr:hypothetical protein [Deltaproteobacteria bacterium]
MKIKINHQMVNLVQAIGVLAREHRQLTHQAVLEYAPEVEAILRDQCRDSRRIEHLLDGILDFCFDSEMLYLYKKLCRYYFEIDPSATVSYVNAYREMWDEKEEGNALLDV